MLWSRTTSREYIIRRVPETSPFPAIDYEFLCTYFGFHLDKVVYFVNGETEEVFPMSVLPWKGYLAFDGWSAIEERYNVGIGWRVLIDVQTKATIRFCLFDVAGPHALSDEETIEWLNDHGRDVSWCTPSPPRSAVEAACMYLTHRDSFIQQIPPSSVGNSGHSIAVDHSFFARYMLGERSIDVVFIMEYNESDVRIKSYEKSTKATAGWKEFAAKNNLRSKDVLVFEYGGKQSKDGGILKDLFHVTPFRVRKFGRF